MTIGNYSRAPVPEIREQLNAWRRSTGEGSVAMTGIIERLSPVQPKILAALLPSAA